METDKKLMATRRKQAESLEIHWRDKESGEKCKEKKKETERKKWAGS